MIFRWYFVEMVLLVLCSALLISQIIIIGGGYVFISKARTKYRVVQDALEDYFTPSGEDQISPFGRVVEQCAEVTAQRLGTTIQAGIRGSLGGTMSAMVPALEKEAIEANPELAFVDMLPKSLKKSPVAIQGLQMLLSRWIASQPKSSGNNHKSKESGSQSNLFQL